MSVRTGVDSAVSSIKKNKIRPKKISKVIQQEKSKITKKIVSESNSKVAHLKTKINPKYPYLSRVYKEEGKGSYQVFLNEDGSVKEVKTISTSGYKRLDKAALNWLRRAEFKIPKNSTNREVIQEIVFELK